MKTFYIRLNPFMDFVKAKGETIIEAATRVYEKMCNEKDAFQLSLICYGYEDGYSAEDPDHTLYFAGELVAANAGDFNMANALKKLGEEDENS